MSSAASSFDADLFEDLADAATDDDDDNDNVIQEDELVADERCRRGRVER